MQPYETIKPYFIIKAYYRDLNLSYPDIVCMDIECNLLTL